MKHIRFHLLFMLIIAVSFQYCRSNHKAESGTDTKIPDSATIGNKVQGTMFIKRAASGCMLGIELGKLANEKANNPKVKDFGKLMEEEQGQILTALKELSMIKGLQLPMSLSRHDKAQIEGMRKMETKYFEKLYMKMMLENSRKYIELYQGTSRSPDLQISNFGKKYLPILERQLQKAFEAQETIK
jgi:putative membrane protein